MSVRPERDGFNVLFPCAGARSILADSILRKDGAGRFNAFSAGSHPKGAINPLALKALAAYGYPTCDGRPEVCAPLLADPTPCRPPKEAAHG